MDEYNDFKENFDIADAKLLDVYFLKLNSFISLSKKDTKLFNEDFQKIITYYYKKGMKVKEILKILSLDNLGTCYKDNPMNWYPLDNSAKIYPLSMKENWMSVFRVSYYLKEPVIPEVFQIALTFTMKRFPTFRTTIRKGFFWHYIDEIKKRFSIYEDKKLPCSYINVSNIRKQSFKAVYYKNRISVEYFHILTDGYGGVVFISTLVAMYLKLLGKKISYNEIVLNVKDHYQQEELKDSFVVKNKKIKSNSLMEGLAVQVDGKLSTVKPAQVLHFDMHIKDLKKASKKYKATITEFILALMFITLLQSSSKKGKIKIQVPIDMRKYYPSKTLRNFSLYIIISIDRQEITSLEDIIEEVKRQMIEKNNTSYLNGTMAYATKLVSSIKYLPLFIKKPIASIVYGFVGDRSTTSVLSNMGTINISEDMTKYVEKMDFVLGTAITNRVLFSMITVNDMVTLSITKYTNNTAVENILYAVLKDNDISIKVHGSEQYENRK